MLGVAVPNFPGDKNMKKLTVILILLFMSGCAIELAPEGTRLTPVGLKPLDGGIQLVEDLGSTAASLGLIWPPAAGIGGVLLGIAGAVRKMKPKLKDAESEVKSTRVAINDLIKAVEVLKDEGGDAWQILKPILSKNTTKETKALVSKVKGA